MTFSMGLKAHGENCDQNPLPELADIMELKKAIEWQAAPDNTLKTAHCLRITPFTEEEMQNWLRSKTSPTKISETINGIHFENETPENLNTFRLLTSKLDILDNPIPSKTKNFKSNCKNVNCALKEIFGSTGTQLQFMHQKFGFNGSHLAYDEASRWKKEQLDTALLALSDYPEGLLPQEKNQQFVHAPPGYGEEGILANATITVFDAWDSKSPEYQRSTIFHEVAHFFASQTGIDESEKWMSKSGWEKTSRVIDGKKITQSEAIYPYTIVSDYGMTNEWEDFAESVVAYRYNPSLLKEVDPDKFELLKKFVFDNVDYSSEASCKNPRRTSSDLKQRANNLANNWQPKLSHLQKISEACTSMAVNELAEKGTIPLASMEFYQCYKDEIQKFSNAFIKAQYKDHPDKKFVEALMKNVSVEFKPEKMLNLITQTRNHHAQTLRQTLLEAGSKEFACSESSASYAYQNFKQELLGINTYEHREALNKVNRVFCTTLKKHSPEATIQGMIR